MSDVVLIRWAWIPRILSTQSPAVDVKMELSRLASSRALPYLRAWNVVLHAQAHNGCTFPQNLHTVPRGAYARHLPPPLPRGGLAAAGEAFAFFDFFEGALVERERTGSGSDRGLLESSAGPNGSRSTTASSFANGSTNWLTGLSSTRNRAS